MLVTLGELLVEMMAVTRGQPLDRPGSFIGPYPSGAPAIFADQAARQGYPTAIAGVVADDGFGDCVVDRLRGDGVDVSAVRRVAAKSLVDFSGAGVRRSLAGTEIFFCEEYFRSR